MDDNIFVKFAKALAKSRFKELLNKISKEIEEDHEIQSKITDIKDKTNELQDVLEHLCKKQPWHELCKGRTK